MRAHRHHIILRLVRSHPVTSQEQLAALLADEGLEVNQATLSRDLRALGVVKLPQPDGRSRYVVTPKGPDRAVLVGNLRSFLRELVPTGNLVVVRTTIGGAQPVALALDQLGVEGLVGTVAGDDTVLAVLGEGVASRDVMDRIWRLVDA